MVFLSDHRNLMLNTECPDLRAYARMQGAGAAIYMSNRVCLGSTGL